MDDIWGLIHPAGQLGSRLERRTEGKIEKGKTPKKKNKQANSSKRQTTETQRSTEGEEAMVMSSMAMAAAWHGPPSHRQTPDSGRRHS